MPESTGNANYHELGTDGEPEHAMTLRIPKDLAADTAAVAKVEGYPVSKLVRVAIYEHIKAKRADKEFQKRLTASLKRNQAVLERLRGR